MPRFGDAPEIETILVNRPDLRSVGVGETPIIGIAPAIANALFHATQTRIRRCRFGARNSGRHDRLKRGDGDP